MLKRRYEYIFRNGTSPSLKESGKILCFTKGENRVLHKTFGLVFCRAIFLSDSTFSLAQFVPSHLHIKIA